MKKGFWNYTEQITYRVILVRILEAPEQPLHWQNAFQGLEFQAVEITSMSAFRTTSRGPEFKKQTFLINNQDGTGLLKISRLGGPDSYHAGIGPHEFIRELPESEWQYFNKLLHDQYQWESDHYHKIHNEMEFKKLQALQQAINDTFSNPRKRGTPTEPNGPEGMPDDEPAIDTSCPNCGTDYDEIDQEYQICHICKFNNTKKPEQ